MAVVLLFWFWFKQQRQTLTKVLKTYVLQEPGWLTRRREQLGLIGEEPSLQAWTMATLSFIFQYSVTVLKSQMLRYTLGWPGLDCAPTPWPVSVRVCTCAFLDPTKIPRYRHISPQKKNGNAPSKGKSQDCCTGKSNNLYYQDAICIQICVWNKGISSSL